MRPLGWLWPARQIPPEFRGEFESELAWACFVRSRAVAAAMGAFHLALLGAVDLRHYLSGSWSPGLANLCALHAAMVLLSGLTLLAGAVRRPQDLEGLRPWHRATACAFPAVALLWCAAVSVNDQLLQREITVYIAGAIAVGAAFPQPPLVSLATMGAAMAAFSFGLASVPVHGSLEGHYLNAGGVTLVAWVLSTLLFGNRVQDYLNRRTIARQREALDAARVREEQQRLELKLQEAQRMESLGLLAGGVAHDFNNLLGAIRTNVSLALADLAPDSPIRESLDDVQVAVQRAAELSNQMLAYSGRGRFVVQPVDLSEVVSEMARLASSTVPKKCAVTLELGRGLPAVEADLAQLRQVVLNLLTNAAEAVGDQPGLVLVRTFARHCTESELSRGPLGAELPAGEYLVLEVVDDGCGMTPEVQARIFDPFFSTKFTGRGLGLAAVLGILKGHRGAIEIDSTPGKGTTFRVLFPASARPAQPLPAPGRGGEARARGRVLLVDDEALLLRGTQRYLARMGLEVETAEDGQAGVTAFRASLEPSGRAFDAVVVDLSMPGMDGFEVIRELRRLRPSTPVVLTSGYTSTDLAAQMSALGLAPPTAFLQKPYDTQLLMDELQRILRGAPRG